MNNPLQAMHHPAVIAPDSIHIIEDESAERSAPTDLSSQESKKQLQDARTTWQDVNGVVRQVGRFLIHREMAALKTMIAANVPPREDSTATPTAAATVSTAAPKARLTNHPNKRRRISGSNTTSEIQPSPVSDRMEEALRHKMNRMRRLKTILKSLSDSHIELEKEISDMIGEAAGDN